METLKTLGNPTSVFSTITSRLFAPRNALLRPLLLGPYSMAETSRTLRFIHEHGLGRVPCVVSSYEHGIEEYLVFEPSGEEGLRWGLSEVAPRMPRISRVECEGEEVPKVIVEEMRPITGGPFVAALNWMTAEKVWSVVIETLFGMPEEKASKELPTPEQERNGEMFFIEENGFNENRIVFMPRVVGSGRELWVGYIHFSRELSIWEWYSELRFRRGWYFVVGLVWPSEGYRRFYVIYVGESIELPKGEREFAELLSETWHKLTENGLYTYCRWGISPRGITCYL